MDNQDAADRPRLKVVDTAGASYNGVRKRKRKNTKSRGKRGEVVGYSESPSAQEDEQFPIEALPVMRSVIEYGKRTHALGTLKGAIELRKLTEKIRLLGPTTIELDEIVADAEKSISDLMVHMQNVYKDA